MKSNIVSIQDARKKAKPKRMLRLPLILLLIICGVYAYSLGQEYLRYRGLNHEVARYEQRLAEAEAEYTALSEERSLHFNEEYIERLARKNLGMIREGETLLYPMEAKDVPVINDNVNEELDIH